MLLAPAKDSLDVSLVVGDIAKSLAFYCDTLGLAKTHEVETPFGTVHRLQYASSILYVIDPRQPPPKGPVGIDQQLGLRFLAFAITNLDEVCAVLHANGTTFLMPATDVLPGRRVAMVMDPDDNVLELVEQR